LLISTLQFAYKFGQARTFCFPVDPLQEIVEPGISLDQEIILLVCIDESGDPGDAILCKQDGIQLDCCLVALAWNLSILTIKVFF